MPKGINILPFTSETSSTYRAHLILSILLVETCFVFIWEHPIPAVHDTARLSLALLVCMAHVEQVPNFMCNNLRERAKGTLEFSQGIEHCENEMKTRRFRFRAGQNSRPKCSLLLFFVPVQHCGCPVYTHSRHTLDHQRNRLQSRPLHIGQAANIRTALWVFPNL